MKIIIIYKKAEVIRFAFIVCIPTNSDIIINVIKNGIVIVKKSLAFTGCSLVVTPYIIDPHTNKVITAKNKKSISLPITFINCFLKIAIINNHGEQKSSSLRFGPIILVLNQYSNFEKLSKFSDKPIINSDRDFELSKEFPNLSKNDIKRVSL